MIPASWRTTLAGISTILAALAIAGKAFFDTDPATNVDWSQLSLAITAGLGLINARDNKVTSAQAGAEPK